ncbi:MAG: endonuclease NucS [Thermodesulfobacteriota bacterium]|nr:endonuclease NucS [Thermodesulfobacteriota bacterium]
MALYEKSVKLLFRDMVDDLSLQKGDILERDRINSWFKQKYPLIKPGTISAHLLKLSINAPSRIHYNVDQNGRDDLLYQIDSKKFRLYDPSSDPDPIYFKPKEDEITNGERKNSNEENGNEFAYEKDLQNFLAKNLSLIEPGLILYMEEDITGIEFPVGNRFIDILATDKDNNYIVIELKVSRGYDRVVGQILRYMAWIRKNHAEENQKVRGIIIAREISDDLLLACSETKNVELYEYSLSVSLNKIDDNV